MPAPKNGKHKDYGRYAAHYLDMVVSIKIQDDHVINREMAAEWLNWRCDCAPVEANEVKVELVGD